MEQETEKYWHGTFVLAVAIKTFTGILETVAGAMVLVTSPHNLGKILNGMSHGELTETPPDFFFGYVNQAVHHLSVGGKLFAGLYILSHGVINLLIVAGLIKDKPAAYLIGIGILGAFMLYQILRLAVHYSPLLGVLTIFDAIFIVLIYHEYNYLTKKLAK